MILNGRDRENGLNGRMHKESEIVIYKTIAV